MAKPHSVLAGSAASQPTLRGLQLDDASDVLLAFQSAPDMSRQGDVNTLHDATEYVARLIAPGAAHRPWAVTVDDTLVGLVCVSVDEENHNGWFWYWTAHRARGKGWTGRAAATVADWALNHGGLERLELGHRVNNPASGAVARAAGFIHEGTEREKFLIDGQRIDVATYGRLRSDPLPEYTPTTLHTH